MKKKIILGLAAAGTALAMLPLFAAFEAHVINVTAHIENALSVPIEDRELQFGTVFPQEEFDKTFQLSLSSSFLEQERLDDVEYVIRQKPKCTTASSTLPQFGLVTEDGQGNFVCEDEENYDMMPLLCPYLSKHDGDPEDGNDTGLNAFHGLPGPWTLSTTLAYQAFGKLVQSDEDFTDSWIIDLKVPCFKGSCAQDWDEFVETESASSTINANDYMADPEDEEKLFGCDLWIEVTDYSETETPT